MAEWVPIGTEVMREAMLKRGFSSNEKVARAIPVSTRTWERWIKSGSVPRLQLPRVAEVLDLELAPEQPLEPVVIPRDRADHLVARLEAVADRLERKSQDSARSE
jgi:hypothetical protein